MTTSIPEPGNPEAAPPPHWVERHLPTFLRIGQKLCAAPPLPRPLALFLLAALGILGVIVFVTLAAFAVQITSRP